MISSDLLKSILILYSFLYVDTCFNLELTKTSYKNSLHCHLKLLLLYDSVLFESWFLVFSIFYFCEQI